MIYLKEISLKPHENAVYCASAAMETLSTIDKRFTLKVHKLYSPLIRSLKVSFCEFQFMNEIQTASVTVCTLRAITDLLELYIHFPKLTRNLIKVSCSLSDCMITEHIDRLFNLGYLRSSI